MKAKPLLIIVIVILVVLIIIAVILEILKKGEEEKGLKEIEIAKEIYGFSAEIKGIEGKTLTLEAWIPLADAERESVKERVKAVVTDQTKIVKLKFPEEIPADSQEPVYSEEQEMKFEELEIGEKIDVAAVDNVSEKIKNGLEFEVNQIFIIK